MRPSDDRAGDRVTANVFVTRSSFRAAFVSLTTVRGTDVGDVDSVDRAPFNAAVRSRADRNRSSRLFCRQRQTISTSEAGTVEVRRRWSGGSTLRMP